MSDWNTLHLFDSDRFYNHIIPDFQGQGDILSFYLQSQLNFYLVRTAIEDEVLMAIRQFVRGLDRELKAHKLLPVNYSTERPVLTSDFQKQHSGEIYFFTTVLPLILFSECAQFTPHFILGRNIFTGNISCSPKSIAEACCQKLMTIRFAAIGQNDIGHVMNWLTKEEVELLWLDIQNLQPRTEQARPYVDDFVKFVKIAFERRLGLLSVSNIREDVMVLIKQPKLSVPIDMSAMEFVHLIEYKGKSGT